VLLGKVVHSHLPSAEELLALDGCWVLNHRRNGLDDRGNAEARDGHVGHFLELFHHSGLGGKEHIAPTSRAEVGHVVTKSTASAG